LGIWLLRRVGQVIPTLLILSILIFGLQQLMPGDPAMILAGEERGDPQVLAQIRAELGLDRPIHQQYLIWMGKVLTGDFGFSWRIRVPVSELILTKLPVTFQLATMAFVIAILIGVPLGIVSAVSRDTPTDWAANGVALFGISTPNFWLGIMMILLFSVELGWLPPSGYVPLSEDPWQSLATTIMPAFVLGTGVASVLMRHTRAAMLTALSQDYVRTARAKGLAERLVIGNHANKNALIPLVTVAGMQFGFLIGGTVIIETVFAWPGVGRLVVQAIFSRDYPLVQAAVLVLAVIFVLVNLAVDLVYLYLDPRISSLEDT
jgi:peptide/nickel transport system permease protein